MTFEQAAAKYDIESRNIPKVPANIVIYYQDKGGKVRNASLKAKWFYKDPNGTFETVKRAWEYSCHGDNDKLYSIIRINIEYERGHDGKEENKIDKISA